MLIIIIHKITPKRKHIASLNLSYSQLYYFIVGVHETPL